MNGLLDLIDGGGIGASGDTFEGGPLSGLLNMLGIRPNGYRDRQQQAPAAPAMRASTSSAAPMAQAAEPASAPLQAPPLRGPAGMPAPQAPQMEVWAQPDAPNLLNLQAQARQDRAARDFDLFAGMGQSQQLPQDPAVPALPAMPNVPFGGVGATPPAPSDVATPSPMQAPTPYSPQILTFDEFVQGLGPAAIGASQEALQTAYRQHLAGYAQ